MARKNPDRVPAWLQALYAKGKGSDTKQLSLLDQFYQNTDAVESDKYDRNFYKGVADQAHTLRDIADSRFEDDPSWPDLIQDEYLALYKAVPKHRSGSEMKPTHRINHAVMDKAVKSKDWEQLRTYTELDQWSSAMAAVEFATRLEELFDEMKDLTEAQEEMEKQDGDLQDYIDSLKDADGDPQDLIDGLNEQLDKYGEAIDDVEEAISGGGQEMRRGAAQAVSDARDEVEHMDASLSSFGTDPGQLSRMPAQQRFELASRIQSNEKLRQLADKIGRMVRFAMGEQARKIVHGRDEVYDIELGNDISNVLPSELLTLADEDTEILFLKKFTERGLMQYKLRGTEKVAKGAIICMIDSSGSMFGHPETWAKAVAIALLNIAAKQKRDFYGIIFSSAGDELMEWYFPKGIAAIEDVLDFAEYMYGGGTDFEKPIGRGVEVLQDMFNSEEAGVQGAQKGDLVLITDGECYVSDDWRDRYFNAKELLAFRMYSCLIGTQSATLDVLSDQVYKITDLAHGSNVKDIFGFV